MNPGRGAVVALLILLTGCATVPDSESRRTLAYVAADDGSLAARHAPVIVPEYPGPEYNRIGRPTAERDDAGNVHIFVDPRHPAIYFRQREFKDGDATYMNLIYRIHFRQVPFSLAPFHLTAGDNAGLFIIVTLDDRERPLLVTTVHTCGCYLGFVPTSYLPRGARPPGWDDGGQVVFGVPLPAVLEYPPASYPGLRPLIVTRHATHRVIGIEVARPETLADEYELSTAELHPLDRLHRLPTGDGDTTSFFHERGLRKGYVRDAFKPWEFLLMSWWTFDPFVGVDKEYGPREETGTVFYTSLKPWDRSESDMWRFAEFLDYWGWDLGGR